MAAGFLVRALVYLLPWMGSLLDTELHFYVSPSGSDANSGKSLTSPLATIQKAVSIATRQTTHGYDVYVELLQGYHDLEQTLHVQNTGPGHVTIRAYSGHEVHVTGGRRLDINQFRPVTDPKILSRLPAGAAGHVKVFHLSDANITNYGSISRYGYYHYRTAPLEVFYNGQPLTLAKWPNEGYVDVVGIPDGEHGRRFRYNSTRPSLWGQEPEIWAYGFWYWGWADRAIRIDAINTTSQVISLHEKPTFGLKTGHWPGGCYQPECRYRHQGGYFRVFNVLAELDQLGEYYVDRTSGDLYAWFPSVTPEQTSLNGGVSQDVVYVSLINDCISLGSGTKNVNLRDFTLEACRASGITGQNVYNVNIEKMEVRNTGGYSIALGGDSRGNTISRCSIHDGDGGVSVTGGDRQSLTSSGNVVEDNVIWRYSREGAVGYNAANVGGVGIRVRYNHMFEGQYTAIKYWGNDHVMDYNNIHHVCVTSSDCGAVHTGRDWTSRGNTVRYNHIHHTLLLVPGHDCRGVMLDDQASGTIIEYNTFYDNQVHVNIGGGRDNVVRNNVFYNATSYSMAVDSRGISHKFDATLYAKLRAMPYNSTLWTTHYPAMADMDAQNLSLPEGNQIVRNLVYNVAGREFVLGLSPTIDKSSMYNITENGMVTGASDFYNVSAGDYRARCYAALWASHSGFVDTPTPNQVGPRYSAGPVTRPIAPYIRTFDNHVAPCTTHAPPTHIPVTSYLPDGSSVNTLYNVSRTGCWLSVSACANTSLVGTHRDHYGELHRHAADNDAACFSRAAEVWRYCGSRPNEQVAAIYGHTGAMTIAGDGCFVAWYGCPARGHPSDGHVIPGKFSRDTWAEQHENAANDEKACLSRALALWRYCGSNGNHTVTSIFRPTGAFRTAGAGCWIHVRSCPKHPTVPLMFYDSWGAANLHTDDNKDACFSRADFYWTYCGSHSTLPVTAQYRPLSASHTVPR